MIIRIPFQTTKMVKIICDCCKKEYDSIFELQEFISVKRFGGYESIFGDGNLLELDLCQHCQKKLLGDFIRITEE